MWTESGIVKVVEIIEHDDWFIWRVWREIKSDWVSDLSNQRWKQTFAKTRNVEERSWFVGRRWRIIGERRFQFGTWSVWGVCSTHKYKYLVGSTQMNLELLKEVQTREVELETFIMWGEVPGMDESTQGEYVGRKEGWSVHLKWLKWCILCIF